MVQRALVLSGGGAKGIYEVGCLEALLAREPGLDFDYFIGISAGALNAAYLAQASMSDGYGTAQSCAALRRQVTHLCKLWQGVDEPSDIYKGAAEPSAFTMAKVALGKDSLLDATPIRRMIEKNISTDAAKRSGREFHVGAVSLESGRYVWFDRTTKDLDLVRAVKASTAVPAMFPPVKYGKDLLVDGAIRNNTPLSWAYKKDPRTEIVVIQTSPIAGGVTQEKWDMDGGLLSGGKGALDVLVRSARIMSDEVQKDDVEGAAEWNKAIREIRTIAAALGGAAEQQVLAVLAKLKKRFVPIRVYAPDQPLLKNELVFKEADMNAMYRAGLTRGARPGVEL